MIKHIEILRLLDFSRNGSSLTLVPCVPLIINYESSDYVHQLQEIPVP